MKSQIDVGDKGDLGQKIGVITTTKSEVTPMKINSTTIPEILIREAIEAICGDLIDPPKQVTICDSREEYLEERYGDPLATGKSNGFYDFDEQHIWIDGSCSLQQVAVVLAHELCHHIQNETTEPSDFDFNAMEEEADAFAGEHWLFIYCDFAEWAFHEMEDESHPWHQEAATAQ